MLVGLPFDRLRERDNRLRERERALAL